jgi:DNA-binding NarL/FixJ family response regulator
MKQSPIRLIIAEDNEVLRQSLVMTLELYDGLQCVGEAANGLEAIELCKHVQPDVILIDLLMPVMDGAAAIPPIRHLCPDAQIIVLTSGFDYRQVEKVRDLKPAAVLFKNVTVDTLVSTIRRVAAARSSKDPQSTLRFQE